MKRYSQNTKNTKIHLIRSSESMKEKIKGYFQLEKDMCSLTTSLAAMI